MTELIAPHGGLTEPVERLVPAAEVTEFQAQHQGLPALLISHADLSTLYRIGDGALSPLLGPMDATEFHRVLEEEVFLHQGKKYAWTIPLAFPVAQEVAATLTPGSTVALRSPENELVGSLLVKEVYPFDKQKYLQAVYQTSRTDHEGARMVLDDPRTFLVGGTVRVLPQKKLAEYGHYLLSPREMRVLIQQKGWQQCVAFQTRNPLHRAHEYALIVGLERLIREGHFAGAVLNPLVGETKKDDVDALTRMRTYRALIEGGAFGQGDIDEALWESKGYRFQDHVLLAALDIKMFYAGPKEAIMHAIYRQNYGFSHIIIGRKHADAPYDDGTDIWEGLAAQEKFDQLAGELLIKPIKVGFAAFFEELGRVGLVEEYQPKGYHPVSISGRELRTILREGKLPDPRIMRRETAEVLIAAMQTNENAN